MQPSRSATVLVATVVTLLGVVGCSAEEQQGTLSEAEQALADYQRALADVDTKACEMETDAWVAQSEVALGATSCEERVEAGAGFLDRVGYERDGTDYVAAEGGTETQAVVTATYAGDWSEAYVMRFEDGQWRVHDAVTAGGFGGGGMEFRDIDGDGDTEHR